MTIAKNSNAHVIDLNFFIPLEFTTSPLSCFLLSTTTGRFFTMPNPCQFSLTTTTSRISVRNRCDHLTVHG